MAQKFYVASCMFTELEPALSRTVQAYVRECFNLPIIRCCVANYRVADCDNRVPDWYREEWRAIKHYEKFPAGSTLVSICHNCSAIYEEQHPEIQRESIWELILSDEDFKYPNHGGEAITSKPNSAATRCISRNLRGTLRLLQKDFATAQKVYSNRTPTSKSGNSCGNTAPKSRQKKSRRIAITACAD